MERIARIAGHVNASSRKGVLCPVPTAESPIIAKLKAKMEPLIKEKIALKAELLKKAGDTKIQDLTVEMCINGARSIKAMVTDTSDLDANIGIAYRGKSLYECNKELPKAPGGEVGLPEAAFWLLLTGEVPSDADCNALTEELHKRATIPQFALDIMDALPKDMHPMTQISMSILALQKTSKFQAAYDAGMKKDEYWKYALEDSLDIIARIPVIAARIYHRTFKNGSGPAYDPKLDWAGNYANMIGTSSDPLFKEATRLYLMVHADHEGGNVSAHTVHLVGSALSDPYYSLGAGLCGLAGPLHGLANQECLAWLLQVQKDLGNVEPTKEVITEYAKKTLAAGKVIPGFGHAVLRKTDPRYMLEREFALKHMQGDPLFKLVDACYQALPPLLESLGKVKNPNPNVDAHSGQIMSFYGLTEQNYYTVVFAVSRSMGVLAQLVWARAIGLPIERPKSVPLDVLAKTALKK
jgi:citrate synthase|mmetsp:Transcript_16603/g.26353  ORF Transcript_16603/g.26353 Transcript_16603/m.26353 type:complete len:467 (+) Transcript_16603:63-1463(+)